MLEPRGYQQEGLDAIDATRQKGKKSVLVVMASGLGKTVLAALDAKKWIDKRGGRLLFLCHQNEILEQARTTFEFVLGRGYSFGYFHGREKARRPVTCLFASFQTMRGRREHFRPDEFSYIVVDESHHGPAPTYKPVLDYFRPEFFLAITATPERTDLQDIRKIYGEEVFSLHLDEALAQGLLTPVDYRLLTDDIQNEETLDTPVGKLSIKLLNKTLFIPRRDEEIAEIIRKRMLEMESARVIVFCPSIAHCERFAAHLPDAFPIHSKLTPQEQSLRLAKFREGLVNIVLTVDKFNEGIDIPEANVIVFLRSTASRMLFFQQLGRGLRKVPGKKRALVLDFVGNCERLEMVSGLWKAVGERRSPYDKQGRGDSPFSVDMGRVRFTEVAKRVLDVISAVRNGYTKEVLIKQLFQLAGKLGRTPRKDDIAEASRRGQCASPDTFRAHFGSIVAALKTAGFPSPIRRRYGRGGVIQHLGGLAKELGKRLTVADVLAPSRTIGHPSRSTIQKLFGSVTAALKAAGQRRVAIERRPPERKKLLGQLARLRKKLGRDPTYREVVRASKEGECAHPKTFSKVFGSLTAALKADKPK